MTRINILDSNVVADLVTRRDYAQSSVMSNYFLCPKKQTLSFFQKLFEDSGWEDFYGLFVKC